MTVGGDIFFLNSLPYLSSASGSGTAAPAAPAGAGGGGGYGAGCSGYSLSNMIWIIRWHIKSVAMVAVVTSILTILTRAIFPTGNPSIKTITIFLPTSRFTTFTSFNLILFKISLIS